MLQAVLMVTESVTRLPWRLDKRVLPQHTDHGGVMWHGAYVGWLEEARVEALAAVGLPYRLMAIEQACAATTHRSRWRDVARRLCRLVGRGSC